jgi:hypothetical protein
MRDGASRVPWRVAIGTVMAGALAATVTGPLSGVGAQAAGLGTPRPFDTTVQSDRGSGRIDVGEACSEGGDGGYWHYDYESPLAAGVITGALNTLPNIARLHLDLHSEHHGVRATPGEAQPGQAWLQGNESAVTLSNQRGTVTARLRSVDDPAGAGCNTAHGLTFTGLNAAGGGLKWDITDATGSYREAVGAGTATLNADVAPGADNAFNLRLLGDIAVLQPNLKLEVVDTYWGFLGAHYLLRIVTVIYRVTNVGPGDAFGVRLTGASSPTQGVKLVGPIPFDTTTHNLGPVPQHLADLPEGQSEIVRLRWKLPLPAGDPPCYLVVLGCKFDTTLKFDMPDALDVVEAPKESTVQVKAPNFPPPVVD